MLTGDVGRTATLAREGRLGDAALGAVPPAQVHARVAGGGRRRDHRPPRPDGLGRGQVRRHPRPAPPRGRRGPALLAATCTTSAASSPRSSRARATCPGRASSTASCSPGRTAWCCRSSQLQARLGRKNPSAEILADVPVIFVAWDVLGLDAGPRTRVVASLLDEPLTERRRRLEGLDLPLASDGGGFALSYLVSVDSVDGLEAAFAQARARRNEGLMVKDPDEPVLPGPPGPRLAEDEEGARDDRLRGRGRRGRARQAPRRPLGLHVRGPRRVDGRARHDRQGVQRPDRRRDRRDDGAGSRRTRSRRSAATGRSSRRSWSRSPST